MPVVRLPRCGPRSVGCAALMLVVALSALAPCRAVSQATPRAAEHVPSGPPLHSTVFSADGGVVRRGDHGMVRALVDTATSNLSRLEIHVTTLAPGRSLHAAHRHAHEEVLVLRSGVLDVLQNGVTRRAGPGDVIFQASNELHGLRNPGPDSATYVVVRIDPHDLHKPARP